MSKTATMTKDEARARIRAILSELAVELRPQFEEISAIIDAAKLSKLDVMAHAAELFAEMKPKVGA